MHLLAVISKCTTPTGNKRKKLQQQAGPADEDTLQAAAAFTQKVGKRTAHTRESNGERVFWIFVRISSVASGPWDHFLHYIEQSKPRLADLVCSSMSRITDEFSELLINDGKWAHLTTDLDDLEDDTQPDILLEQQVAA